ncbi:Cupin domain-containing protein [Trinickia symbiotica]|uniref:Cupin domain-containing protein n=1 Tax=Trinickia symbiotica TaxID=863227 RepID=A0A2N7X1K6_9BURK|nr:cupin domain-containing protein [Trinickia symbiotica]PMS35451.1 cupin domain-containing protein [Trinickia symbiotica]PPK45477.1 Cupin domain-containing protein [Trinickia symbiotica]
MTHSVTEGRLFDYGQYRDHFADVPEQAVVWPWPQTAKSLAAARHGERGTFTLTRDGTAAGCEIVPGMAINVQVVPPHESTRPHAHAWWHLFIVQSGSGVAHVGEHEEPVRLAPRDVLIVPAWCMHAFHCDADEALVLFSMSNLPQQKSLGNLKASEPEGVLDDSVGHGVTKTIIEGQLDESQ